MLQCNFADLPENVYSVEFAQTSEHVVKLTSPQKLPESTSGFFLSREGMGDRWDYTSYKTVYRKMSNNEIEFSNDGSVFTPPTKDVIVQAIFNDGDNVYGFRPNEVDVQMYKNGKKTAIAALKASKNYKATYKDRPATDVFTIDPPDLDRYEKSVSGTVVTYSVNIPQPRQVSIDDISQVAMSEYEGFYPPFGLNNIYASYCENELKNFKDVPDTIKESVNEVILSDGFMVNEDGTVSLRPINLEEGGSEA